MRNGINEDNRTDQDGNPAGGMTTGVGIIVRWQNGPLGRGIERAPANGAFVEDVIAAARGRLDFYQNSKFHCEENALAIVHLDEALRILNERTKAREIKGVEGTHNV